MKQFTIILSLLVVALFSFSSCKKVKNTSYNVTGDYLVAGHTGGYVIAGSRTPFYVLNNGEMRKDTSVVEGAVPAGITGFNFNVLLPAINYDSAAYLQTSIPSELFALNGAHIGRYFVDYGYTVVMTRKDGVEYKWYFEGDLTGCSASVQAFMLGISTQMLGK